MRLRRNCIELSFEFGAATRRRPQNAMASRKSTLLVAPPTRGSRPRLRRDSSFWRIHSDGPVVGDSTSPFELLRVVLALVSSWSRTHNYQALLTVVLFIKTGERIMARDNGDHPMGKPNAGHADLNRRYGDYQRRVFRYVRKHHPDVSAEDVAQETVERVLRRRYDNPGDALLFKIATNIVHDLRRRRQVASHMPLDLCIPSPAISPEEQTIDKLDGHLARRALAELGPSDRKLIESVHIDDVDRRDLSQREHITYAALRKRLSRARRRLCAHFARLSRVVIPAWVGFDLLRSLRRNLQTVMVAGASGVAVVAAVGFGPGPGGPHAGPDVDGGVQTPPTSVIRADAWSSSGSASADVPESGRFATPRPATSDVAGAGGQSAAVAEPVLPVRSNLEVSPGTGAGRKQTNLIVVDTPVGPVATGGHSEATGPALEPGFRRSPGVAGAGSGIENRSQLGPLRVAQR